MSSPAASSSEVTRTDTNRSVILKSASETPNEYRLTIKRAIR